MREGWFSISLTARGVSESGTMRISGLQAVGRCTRCRLRGRITAWSPTLEAIVTVRMTQPYSPSRLLPEMFSMSMSGEFADDVFRIQGAGPLGLIVELVGRSTDVVQHVSVPSRPTGIRPSPSATAATAAMRQGR